MSFIQRNIACIECSTIFPFTAGEQSYYKRNNIPQPMKCKSCRNTKVVAGAVATSIASTSSSIYPTIIKVPSKEYPNLRMTLLSLIEADSTDSDRVEIHLGAGIHELDIDRLENNEHQQPESLVTGSGNIHEHNNERVDEPGGGGGFLFKRNGHHIQIMGVGPANMNTTDTAARDDAITAETSSTTIVSNGHSIFQASGRSIHLELKNLHLLHTCCDEDKSKIGACIFGMGRSHITITNCRLTRYSALLNLYIYTTIHTHTLTCICAYI